jgi:hypothetical protein
VAPLNRSPCSPAKPACLTSVPVKQAFTNGDYWSNRVPPGSNHPVWPVLTGRTGMFNRHAGQTLLFGRWARWLVERGHLLNQLVPLDQSWSSTARTAMSKRLLLAVFSWYCVQLRGLVACGPNGFIIADFFSCVFWNLFWNLFNFFCFLFLFQNFSKYFSKKSQKDVYDCCLKRTKYCDKKKKKRNPK